MLNSVCFLLFLIFLLSVAGLCSGPSNIPSTNIGEGVLHPCGTYQAQCFCLFVCVCTVLIATSSMPFYCYLEMNNMAFV